MLNFFKTLINLLAVLAIATFALTLFCQRLSKKSNWQTSRIISNSYLIVYEVIYITIHYFSNKSFIIDLVTLAIWIINFAVSYYFWQDRKNQ